MPLGRGRLFTKSTTMWDQGLFGTGSGWRSPEDGWLEVLLQAKIEQAATNSWVSESVEGHQNLWHKTSRVQPEPGQHVIQEAWAH